MLWVLIIYGFCWKKNLENAQWLKIHMLWYWFHISLLSMSGNLGSWHHSHHHYYYYDHHHLCHRHPLLVFVFVVVAVVIIIIVIIIGIAISVVQHLLWKGLSFNEICRNWLISTRTDQLRAWYLTTCIHILFLKIYVWFYNISSFF